MALIRCSECGKEISSKAKACIHCGCPIEEMEVRELEQHGMLMVSMDKSPGVPLMPFEKKVDIVAESNKVLFTLHPGENKTLEIHEDLKIYAARLPYTSQSKKEKTLNQIDHEAYKKGGILTDLVLVPSKGTTRVQVSIVSKGIGIGTKLLMNIVDVIDSV